MYTFAGIQWRPQPGRGYAVHLAKSSPYPTPVGSDAPAGQTPKVAQRPPFLCARFEVHCIPSRVFNGVHNPAGAMHFQPGRGYALLSHNYAFILPYPHTRCSFHFFFFCLRVLKSIVYLRGYSMASTTRQGLCTSNPAGAMRFQPGRGYALPTRQGLCTINPQLH